MSELTPRELAVWTGAHALASDKSDHEKADLAARSRRNVPKNELPHPDSPPMVGHTWRLWGAEKRAAFVIAVLAEYDAFLIENGPYLSDPVVGSNKVAEFRCRGQRRSASCDAAVASLWNGLRDGKPFLSLVAARPMSRRWGLFVESLDVWVKTWEARRMGMDGPPTAAQIYVARRDEVPWFFSGLTCGAVSEFRDGRQTLGEAEWMLIESHPEPAKVHGITHCPKCGAIGLIDDGLLNHVIDGKRDTVGLPPYRESTA